MKNKAKGVKDEKLKLSEVNIKNRHVKKMKTPTFFNSDNDKDMFNVKCPQCNVDFGIDLDFLHNTSELNFIYSCPYCNCKGKLID